MKSKLFVAIVLIALTNYACNSTDESSQLAVKEDVLLEHEEEKQPYREMADTSVTKVPSTTNKKQPVLNPDWDKKIIKNASLSIEVKDYKAYSNNLTSLIKKFGGYIANEQEAQSEERLENRVKIKVPVAQFQDLMTALNNSSDKIDNKQVTSEDVTTELVDTKSRVEAKKKIRLRYLDFLGQAKSMEDILRIQKEINGIQEEIEMAEGRVEYFIHSSAYSSIELYYFQQLKQLASNDEPTFNTKISEAFKGGWEIVKMFLVGTITIWPLWLVVIAGIFFYKKRKLLVVSKGNL
jgi:hypothetical protein